MRWPIVATILGREVRDQLRDRRTLFMVFVLPILLYPILGMGVVQFTIMSERKPKSVIVVGVENLPASPALLNPARDGFDPGLFDAPGEAGYLRVQVAEPGSPWTRPEVARENIRAGLAEAVVTVPAGLASDLASDRSARFPIEYVSPDELSQMTYLRVREVLSRWNDRLRQTRLAKDKKSSDYAEPVRTSGTDLATQAEAGGVIWGRLFPFLLVIMALTGAFYPAVDLCAGEKERGTMETLLISPASRPEIVAGKFLTVVLASMTTAALNLASMGLTGLGIAQQLSSKTGGGFSPPTLNAAFWMLVVLVPLAVFFSAVCLALAVLAKSMKEGQYYMTPLYMVSLPLIMLTLMPGIELSPFIALVPITGVGLLLRALIVGDYAVARTFFLPVLVPMAIYGAIALRWAVEQFKREDVLFRESERLDVSAWLRHLIRDRGPTPTAGQALFCFALMLCLAWFAMLGIGDRVSPLVAMGLGHLVFILLPPVALTFLLTSDPVATLRIRRPALSDLALAAGLALAANPIVRELGYWVDLAFPASTQVTEQVEAMFRSIPNLATGVVLFALIPSITEEVAFRGFILSGFERGHRAGTAIAMSAVLFGVLHVMISLFNQLFPAALLGLVLGLIAVRTRSLFPGVVFHFLNNTLGLVTGTWAARPGNDVAGWLFRDTTHGLYRWPLLLFATAATAVLLSRLAPRSTSAGGIAP